MSIKINFFEKVHILRDISLQNDFFVFIFHQNEDCFSIQVISSITKQTVPLHDIVVLYHRIYCFF